MTALIADLVLSRADARVFVPSLDVPGALECLRCGALVGSNDRARRKHRDDHASRDEAQSSAEAVA